MSTLYITEFADATMAGLISPSPLFPIPAPMTPPVAEQNVTIGMSSTQSAAFNAETTFIMVNCDAACSLAFGADPTAVATAQRMGANETRFYGVVPGQKLAVITNS